MKTCNACKEHKPFSDFYRKSDTSDGHTSRCKACVAESKREARKRTSPIRGRVEVPQEHRRTVYTEVILRMREQGLTSDVTTNEMLARVGEL